MADQDVAGIGAADLVDELPEGAPLCVPPTPVDRFDQSLKFFDGVGLPESLLGQHVGDAGLLEQAGADERQTCRDACDLPAEEEFVDRVERVPLPMYVGNDASSLQSLLRVQVGYVSED